MMCVYVIRQHTKNQIYQYTSSSALAPRLVITWPYVPCGYIGVVVVVSLTWIHCFLYSFSSEGFFVSKIFSPHFWWRSMFFLINEHYENEYMNTSYGLISSGPQWIGLLVSLKKGFWQIRSLWSLSLSISTTRASHFSRVVRALADSIKGTVSRIISQPCTHEQCRSYTLLARGFTAFNVLAQNKKVTRSWSNTSKMDMELATKIHKLMHTQLHMLNLKLIVKF